ncbi:MULTISPECIES: hypothetical protein [Serratia]|uniref:hypothetical protein n=1 Tax=Serratia TaxID=613 RepID=UPI000BD36725|nr:hypothetical protein [Serratia sp. JKS296]SOD79827.1 hypothetical protein SAMN06272783_4978 [Serratia sp. JKS296]
MDDIVMWMYPVFLLLIPLIYIVYLLLQRKVSNKTKNLEQERRTQDKHYPIKR